MISHVAIGAFAPNRAMEMVFILSVYNASGRYLVSNAGDYVFLLSRKVCKIYVTDESLNTRGSLLVKEIIHLAAASHFDFYVNACIRTGIIYCRDLIIYICLGNKYTHCLYYILKRLQIKTTFCPTQFTVNDDLDGSAARY